MDNMLFFDKSTKIPFQTICNMATQPSTMILEIPREVPANLAPGLHITSIPVSVYTSRQEDVLSNYKPWTRARAPDAGLRKSSTKLQYFTSAGKRVLSPKESDGIVRVSNMHPTGVITKQIWQFASHPFVVFTVKLEYNWQVALAEYTSCPLERVRLLRASDEVARAAEEDLKELLDTTNRLTSEGNSSTLNNTGDTHNATSDDATQESPNRMLFNMVKSEVSMDEFDDDTPSNDAISDQVETRKRASSCDIDGPKRQRIEDAEALFEAIEQCTNGTKSDLTAHEKPHIQNAGALASVVTGSEIALNSATTSAQSMCSVCHQRRVSPSTSQDPLVKEVSELRRKQQEMKFTEIQLRSEIKTLRTQQQATDERVKELVGIYRRLEESISRKE